MNFDTNFPPPLLFPVDALPQQFRNLALEIQWDTKAPIELILSSMLGAISLSCQSSVNVNVPAINSISPVSLCITLLAKSGERKTTVDKLTMKSIREFEAKQEELLKPKLVKYAADWMAWNIEKKAILKAIEKVSKIGEPADQLTGESNE